jgi:hypothetical protein
MTWSLEKPKIHTARMKPSVHWDGKPLWQLTDDEFSKACDAAFALGDFTVSDAANAAAAGKRPEFLPEATLIVGEVEKEMGRRGFSLEEGDEDEG